jgi:AraC-like DNA-binding protein
MTDRMQCLREAAQARHDATLRRAEDTLRRLARRGEPITYRRVAEQAGVSRSWLYRQNQLRRQINQLRDAAGGPEPALPAAERATVDSLRQQLHTYRDEITRLRADNQALREQLARRLGADRAAAVTNRP